MNIINLILSFGKAYWLDVILVLMLILALVLLWKKGQKKKVLHVINWLVAEAEKELGSKTGQYKKGKVIEALYNRLPIVITLLFTRKEIEEFIDEAVYNLKEFLKKKENSLNRT